MRGSIATATSGSDAGRPTCRSPSRFHFHTLQLDNMLLRSILVFAFCLLILSGITEISLPCGAPFFFSFLSFSLANLRELVAAAATPQPKHTANKKKRRKSATGSGVAYSPGHAQPPTDIFSHVWCESDLSDGGGFSYPFPLLSSFSPATPASH